jgi:hypothetical protein
MNLPIHRLCAALSVVRKMALQGGLGWLVAAPSRDMIGIHSDWPLFSWRIRAGPDRAHRYGKRYQTALNAFRDDENPLSAQK